MSFCNFNITRLHIVVLLIFILLIVILLINLIPKICKKSKVSINKNHHTSRNDKLENFSSDTGEKDDKKIHVFKTKSLHTEPDVTLIKNFLTKEEADYIIKLGEPHIKKSEVCGKNGSRPDKSRTSMTAHIGKKYLRNDKPDPILTRILEKTNSYCGLPVENIEPIQLVRYEPGQYFKPHYDYLDTKVDMYKKNVAKNGQRKYTFFVYLTDVPKNAGGTTYFPKLDKHFSGGKGDAIYWDNMGDNGKEDTRMLHSGTELKKGKKYGLNIWVRDKEYIG